MTYALLLPVMRGSVPFGLYNLCGVTGGDVSEKVCQIPPYARFKSFSGHAIALDR